MLLTGLSLSSGDVETSACVRGLVASRSVNNVMTEIGPPHALDFTTDSLASLGHCSRQWTTARLCGTLRRPSCGYNKFCGRHVPRSRKFTDAQTQPTESRCILRGMRSQGKCVDAWIPTGLMIKGRLVGVKGADVLFRIPRRRHLGTEAS